MIYAVVSDIHANAWSVFSRTDMDGVNSRLRIVLNELERAAATLIRAGGKVMIIAGDILHTRGTIDPEVLNPLRATFRKIMDSGIDIYAIPGNHDLKSKDSSELSSAIQNLAGESINGSRFTIVNSAKSFPIEGKHFGFVPWRLSHDALIEDLTTLSKEPGAAGMSVFIHAGIDGVISGMPGSGLTDAVLAGFGFKRLFAGHYHNHKVMAGGKVISVGATTHHNWGDVDTKAGFLIVDTDGDVTFYDTQAPKFVDISGMSELEMEMECKGNYVRYRGDPMTQLEVNEIKKQLQDWGAEGVSIEVPRVTTPVRGATATTKTLSLESSVGNFVDSATVPAGVDKEAVKRRALDVLSRSRLVFEEA